MEEINGVVINVGDYIIKCQASIPSIVNTLKKYSFHKLFIMSFSFPSLMKNTTKYIKSNSISLFKNV